jgi:antitoxin component of RelBE/YafQ-DinJ toxin-antitoxin module
MKKTSKIIFRISDAEKQAIQEFCKDNNQSMSELIRTYFKKLITHE